MSPRTAVLTTAAGRHRHLQVQSRGLATGTPPDLQVVASMGDRDIEGVVRRTASPWPVLVVDVPLPASGGLPLAAARNAAAAAAVERGADVLVFLDVDCVPGPALVSRYAQTAGALAGQPALLCGTVAYLPPLDVGHEYDLARLPDCAEPHPARPVPAAGELLRATDVRLFWSLSFAVTAAAWATVGGFDEAYTGYGAEDTDLAMRLDRAGGSMWWVGGADAYHQHHDSEVPPVRHTASIVRNANLFHDRWGWYPMEGWLADLADRGLVERSRHGWRVL